MAEQQGVSLSLCPHEAQSLGMMISAYKSTWSGHMPCCLPFSPLPVHLWQMEEVPEEVAVCLLMARTKCKAVAGICLMAGAGALACLSA